MELAQLDQAMTPVPLEAAQAALRDHSVSSALPANDLEHGTACVLAAAEGRLWIVCRVDGGGPEAVPDVVVDAVEWPRVGIGPQGLVGRVPGGLLGGPEATFHLVTVQADGHLYEARLAGEHGMEAVEDFVSVARHAGAGDLEP